MRHLTEEQAVAALGRRAVIEQMLSIDLRTGSFRWLDARPSGATFVLRLHETVDDGTDDFLDVYEFRSVDEDDECGVGVIVGEFPDVTSLLDAAADLRAVRDRWVNAGVIQEEYWDIRQTR